ncbi:ABC transporter substrate-binding protein [Arthrobacter sp. W4I7]|uniref:ABC transporter substrate-binding protein n=1 Tax=Arthrobacter sp. W4I7 TaxID=3042296 RepID=UPI00278A3A5B|nr:ABC transporter substrate-binding protein [Arthrobacter sp. W4I7]MDQ0691404.1 branched-chain amino acid transport system substrate-binding protein [Arthrobacter sp. W4I7]
MKKKQFWGVMGAATSAALMLTACAGGSAAEESSGGLKGEPIKLMSITPTDTSGANFPAELNAARASVRAINARGGIDGRPLELLYCNQKNEATASEACARKAVDEGVLAIVAYFASRGATQVHDILEAAGIPILAGNPVGSEDFTSPIAFNVDGGTLSGYALCPTNLKLDGATTHAMVRADVDAAAGQEPVVAAGVKGANLHDSGMIVKIPQTATDFSGYVRQLQAAGVDAVTAALAEPQAIQLIQTAESLGTNLMVCGSTQSMSTDSLKKLGKAADRFHSADFPPLTSDSKDEHVQAFIKDLAAEEAAGNKAAALEKSGAPAFRGWEGPRIVERVAPKVKGELNAKSFMEALRTETALDADMFGTVDFSTPGLAQPSVRNYHGWLTRWDSGAGSTKLVSPEPADALPMLRK